MNEQEILKEIELQRERETRIQSVYANLAIDDPTITIEEVRNIYKTKE